MESRRMRSRSQILKWVCYAVALFVCAALQTTPGLLQLGQAKPLFILPLCLAVAVYEGEFAGALFGAVSGLLWDYTAGHTPAKTPQSARRGRPPSRRIPASGRTQGSYRTPWQVRASTSSCCSRVRSMNLTA